MARYRYSEQVPEKAFHPVSVKRKSRARQAMVSKVVEGDALVSWVMRWEGGLCVRMSYECCAVQMCSR